MPACELRDPDRAENLFCTHAEAPDDDVHEIPPDAARKERTCCQHSIGIVAQKRRAREVPGSFMNSDFEAAILWRFPAWPTSP